MLIKVNRPLNAGEAEFVVDEQDKDKALEMAIFLTARDYCTNCKGTDCVVWDSNRAKTEKGEFIYIKRRCVKCTATSNVGKYQSGGLFWKAFEIYEKGGTTAPSVENAPKSPPNAPQGKISVEPDEINIDDIPF